MEKDSQASDDDEFKRTSRRAYQDSCSESSSSDSANSGYGRRDRGRSRSKSRTRSKSQRRQKTGKKVRSHSRPKRKHRTRSSESDLSGDHELKNEVQVKFVHERKSGKAKTVSAESGEMKRTKSTGVQPLPMYEEHVAKVPPLILYWPIGHTAQYAPE